MSIVLRICSKRVRLVLSSELESEVGRFFYPCIETDWTAAVDATVELRARGLICHCPALPEYSCSEVAHLMGVQRVLLDLCGQLHAADCLLHAAGVQVGGRLILFLGASNSGKSSFSFQAVSQGATYISDDALAIVDGHLWGLARSIRFNSEDPKKIEGKAYLQSMNTKFFRKPFGYGELIIPIYDRSHETLASVALSSTPVIIIKLERGESRLKKISEFEAIVHLHESAILTGKEYPGGLKIESAYQLTWQNPEESWELLSHEIFASGL